MRRMITQTASALLALLLLFGLAACGSKPQGRFGRGRPPYRSGDTEISERNAGSGKGCTPVQLTVCCRQRGQTPSSTRFMRRTVKPQSCCRNSSSRGRAWGRTSLTVPQTVQTAWA